MQQTAVKPAVYDSGSDGFLCHYCERPLTVNFRSIAATQSAAGCLSLFRNMRVRLVNVLQLPSQMSMRRFERLYSNAVDR